MALATWTPKREVIELEGGSFNVTGLSSEDFSQLVSAHFQDLDKVFEIVEGGFNKEGGDVDPFAMASTLLKRAPGLVANIIALAANEPGAVEQAAMLPLGVQIDALQRIGRLTFGEVDGLKKALSAVMQIVGQMSKPTAEIPNQK